MTATAALLVVLSAATHAYWNFLLKRSGGSQLFVGLSKVAEVVMFAPAFLVLVAPNVARYDGLLVLATVGAAFVLANYVFLAVAYSHGDLSFVYPLARGGILLFLPVLAFVTVGERVSLLGALALAVIVSGIVALQLEALQWRALASLGGRLRSPATMFALLAALAAACYTIWDKRAVQRVPAFAYITSTRRSRPSRTERSFGVAIRAWTSPASGEGIGGRSCRWDSSTSRRTCWCCSRSGRGRRAT